MYLHFDEFFTENSKFTIKMENLVKLHFRKKTMKKFVKLCLHSKYTVQISLMLTNFSEKIKIGYSSNNS